jgi:hypothetical protein
MKKNRKVLLLLAFLSLFISLYFIQDTYAKYLTKVDTEVSGAIARWNIVVNNTTIRNNDSLENLIQPVFAGTTHIAEDVIAPTVTGYFELIIDSTDVDVSYTYTISIEPNEDLPDFKVSGYKIGNGSITNVDTSAAVPSISRDVLLSDVNRIQTITVYIQWDDNELTQTMDNADDTQVTNTLNDVNLTVNMNFIQKAS